VTNTLLGDWQVDADRKDLFRIPRSPDRQQQPVGYNLQFRRQRQQLQPAQPGLQVQPLRRQPRQHQWINPACFRRAAAGELGNAARVPVVGPDFVNSDFSVIKQFALPRKEMGLNFRAEFFNLFNHPAVRHAGQRYQRAGFGAVNSTVNNPRLIQLALKS
jgi:hypothetical protein